jgi:hypothetical protein
MILSSYCHHTIVIPLFAYGSTALVDLGRFFSFLIYTQSVGILGRRKAATYTQNKRTQTSMSLVGFKPTIPLFEQAKTVHAFDSAAIVIGSLYRCHHIIISLVCHVSHSTEILLGLKLLSSWTTLPQRTRFQYPQIKCRFPSFHLRIWYSQNDRFSDDRELKTINTSLPLMATRLFSFSWKSVNSVKR